MNPIIYLYSLYTNKSIYQMKRPVRDPITQKYTIKNKEYKELFGSREQVWNGTAYKTSGGLTKSQLVMNKNHRIVSASKFQTAKKEKRLEKYGYFAEKGKFGYVKKSVTRKSKPSKSSSKTPKDKMAGGDANSVDEKIENLASDTEPYTETTSNLKPAVADA